jgi:import inner membrane translocase subunit TIM50
MPDAVRAPFDAVYDAVHDNVIAPYAEPSRPELLTDIPAQLKGREKPTLVISLDGTLIESQWTRQFGWRYIKRPGVDEFLAQLAPLYELVLWTECLNSAETVVEKLDRRRVFRHKLYRDATTYTGGLHVKDLSALNRDLSKVLIVDCAPYGYSRHPEHGISLTPYSSAEDADKQDGQLKRLVPFLAYCAIAKSVGSAESLSGELKALGAPTNFAEDPSNADKFEEAVQRRFSELRAQGKMPRMDRNGRFIAGQGSAGGGATGGTIWSRMGLAPR